MKVLLINPPTTNDQVPENPPLGLLYLAASIRDQHDVWVVDLDALKYDDMQIQRRLVKEAPDIIGITATTFSYNSMRRLCELSRKVLPRTEIVIGGPHVSSCPEKSLEETGADHVIVGEGELSFKKMLDDPKDENRKIIKGLRVEELSCLPLPARDLLEPDITYYNGNIPRHVKPETVMMWSRGCPHNCLFCSNTIYMRQKTRFRPPEDIISEIKILSEFGINEIFVYDDELVGMSENQNRWLQKVCNLIISEGLNDIFFKCQGRCSRHVDLETLAIMKKAGFKTIMWGCESGSDKVLNVIRKGTKVLDIEHTIRTCKKSGIEAWMFLMIGNYKETLDDAEKTVRLVRKLSPDFIQVTYATPYPSDFEKICIEKDLIIEPDRSKWNTNVPVAKSEHMRVEEMEQIRNKLLVEGRIYQIKKAILKELMRMEFPYKHPIMLFHQHYKNQGLTYASKKAIEYAKRGFK
ncbi:MAG: radical SAM protein [Candidatus Altiarchaeota archaeon]